MITKKADKTRLVGHIVSNETGTHCFCLFCVSADDPAYGALHEIRANQKEAGNKCAICERKLNVVNGPPRSQRFYTQLQEFYRGRGGLPEYIVEAGKTLIVVSISDWQGKQNLKVTLTDIVTYYQTGFSGSGIRKLAGHSGDWRTIDDLAEEIHAWFVQINDKTLKREFRKAGIQVWW